MNINSVNTVILQLIIALIMFLLGIITCGYRVRKKIKANKMFMHAAFVDALTGLGNRHKFNMELQEKIKHKQSRFALCFLDLDDFKHINDNMGHDAGDELLIVLGKRLEEAISGFGKVYRLGGDEYALIIEKADSKHEVENIVQKVQKSVLKPIEIKENKINLEYSLGISMFPDDTTNSVELINYADAAMYYIKESGKSNYYFHNKALKSQMDSKNKIEKELKIAYANNQFGLDYQPRLNLNNTDDIWLETFLFWNHPVLGKLKAEYFIKNTEVMGLIIQIDEFMIEKAINTASKLKKAGIDNVHVAINVSIRHFQRKDFTDKLCEILEKNKIIPGTIMFEITDTVNTDKIEDYKRSFDRIKEYGVNISVNNLEIKYDTLNMLKRLPIDEVKVSAEYLMSNSIFEFDVLKDIVAFCKDLKYRVIMTRIEDERSFKASISLKADMIQGNYIHGLILEDDLEENIKRFVKHFNNVAK